MPGQQAGILRSQVTFAERIEFQDGYGNTVAAWEDRWTCRAQIEPQKGGEDVMAARLSGRQPVIIRVRQCPETLAVTPDWKVTNVDNGVAYNVQTIIDPGEASGDHGHWLDMLAEAGVAVG